MNILFWIMVTIGGMNSIVIIVMAVMWLFPRCDWCHKRYYIWSSTSSFQNVFCSYRCNYWDMRDYIATNLNVDLIEIDDYMSQRGYPHPEVMEVMK